MRILQIMNIFLLEIGIFGLLIHRVLLFFQGFKRVQWARRKQILFSSGFPGEEESQLKKYYFVSLFLVHKFLFLCQNIFMKKFFSQYPCSYNRPRGSLDVLKLLPFPLIFVSRSDELPFGSEKTHSRYPSLWEWSWRVETEEFCS